MRRAWILGIAVASVGLIPAANASFSTILQGDVDAWGAATGLDARFDEGDAAEMLWQGSDELFPEVQGGQQASSQSRMEVEREARTQGLVVAKLNGRWLTFRDVPESAWFAPYVRGALEKGIVSGYRDARGDLTGEFKPERGVSVEELAKLAVNVTGGISVRCPETPRNGTASGSWSARFVACAEEGGWSVFSDGSIDVRKPATRAQVVVTLLQAFEIGWGERTGIVFMDVPLSVEFGAAVERAKADGLVNGYVDADGKPTGKFGPTEPVTRAEAAKMVMNALELYGR